MASPGDGDGDGSQSPASEGMLFATTVDSRKQVTVAFADDTYVTEHSRKSGGSSKTYLCNGTRDLGGAARP